MIQKWQLRDDEWVEVLPQFLGIVFALGLFSYLFHKPSLLLVALLLLFLLILRIRFFQFLGRLLHSLLRGLGRWFVFLILGGLYLTIISLYSVLYRLLNKGVVGKFSASVESGSSFVSRNKTYGKSDFEKVW